jgi:hypothetical protein
MDEFYKNPDKPLYKGSRYFSNLTTPRATDGAALPFKTSSIFTH